MHVQVFGELAYFVGISFDWFEVWGLTSGDCIMMFIDFFFMCIISCCFVIHLATSCPLFFCMNYSFNKILINYQIYILERLPNGLWLGAFSIHLSWLPMVASNSACCQ